MTAVERLRASRLGGYNPVAKLAAAVVIGLTLIVTTNFVTIVAALLLLSLAVLALRLPLAAVLRVSLVALIAAPLGALTTLLYAPAGGNVFFEWGLITISSSSLAAAWAILLRIIVIAIPSIVLFASIDPSDLATAVALQLRAPTRFVFGSLAALRMLGLMADDWRMLSFARRTRGLGATANPLLAVSRFSQQAFALLALSLRRGEVLATAMEARGLDSGVQRSYVHPAVWRLPDTWFVLLSIAIMAIAVGAAVLTGEWSWAIG